MEIIFFVKEKGKELAPVTKNPNEKSWLRLLLSEAFYLLAKK